MTTDNSSDPALLLPTTSRLRRSRRLWRIIAFLALAVAVLALAARFALPNAAIGDRIARVEILGTIATDPARLEALEKIGDDAAVKAVIVSINSPGGTTAGGEELYEALGALRAKKPVVAVIKEVGASAAYMTAIATDRIFSRRLSIVASIGVLFQTVNAQKLMQTIGVDLEKVATGPLKAEPDLDEPMSPEVRASLQSLVNDSFDWFVDIVAERRGLDRATVLTLADGRIITGRQGIESKLIDAIGGESEAIAWLESDREVPADLPVVTYYPLPKEGFGSIADILFGEARGALGLSEQGPIMLDGLLSLWQGQPSSSSPQVQ
jgi:protease-4